MLYDILFQTDGKEAEVMDVIMKKLLDMQQKNLLRDGQTADSLILSISTTSTLSEAMKDAFYVQVGVTINYCSFSITNLLQ